MITGNQLLDIGLEESKALGVALVILNELPENEHLNALAELKRIITDEINLENTHRFYPVFEAMNEVEEPEIPLLEEGLAYSTYGENYIEEGARNQMNIAMKLPVTKSGALMPDAHQGYGLPIGGVLATNNAVIPYGVGVDIGCRMCLSIYDINPEILETENERLKTMLNHNSKFGNQTFVKKIDHEVLHRSEFNELAIAKQLHQRAVAQIGTSGGGNHFVEFGLVEVTEEENGFGVKPGRYLGLLSHSGSRGLGASIAGHYTKLAIEQCKLPREAKHLAWLDLNTELGQEYWLAMNLAGDYASACHHQIHDRMAVGLRTNPIAMIENHHNFAWKELDEFGNEIIVHRKGATPAGKGVLGIIPGSMTAPGFIVRGKGIAKAINSASHGAGRQMSRTQAKKSLLQEDVSKYLKDHGVDVIGSGLDEAPHAYKDITKVMAAQEELVDVMGTFLPKIVRMCGDKYFFEVD